jgi:hypothetical protein
MNYTSINQSRGLAKTGKLVNGLILSLAISLIAVLIVQAQTVQKPVPEDMVQLVAPDGTTRLLKATADDDEDGIENALEVNGYTYSPIDGLQAWDGDSTKNYYITDPLRWSTDGDPYSDYTEVTGVNMHPAVTWPENNPLVAASPIIVVKMPEYTITPNGEITDTQGGSQSESMTQEASVAVEVGYEETVGGEVGTGGISASASSTLSMSVTASYTQSSTVSNEVNWGKSRSVNPSEAAYLKLGVYYENIGSAPILEADIQFNIVVGQQVIATITPPEDKRPNSLAPGERFPDKSSPYIVIDEGKTGKIALTMDELKSIQLGAPISLVVTQIDGKIGRWNSNTQSFQNDVDWSSWKANIDPVVVNIHADLGDGEAYLYRVYAGTDFYDPGFTFKYLISKVFDVEQTGGQYQIEGRSYPGNWYISSSSKKVQDEWNKQGRPDNIMDLPMHPNTIISMKSPGANPSPDIILATFTPDFKHVLVNATPRGFPILSVNADVTVDGEKKNVALVKNGSFYENSEPFELPADAKGKVYVENSKGDVSEATTILPAFYRSAQEILEYPDGILPIPGGDEYLLFVGGDTTHGAVIYCDFSIGETDTIAREYLTVNSSDINPVAYTEINAYAEQHRYQFKKIRINPRTLKFAVKNPDFVEKEVVVGNGSAYSNNPELGRVVWTYPEIDSAQSVLDLSNTPFYFAIDNVFNNNIYGTIIIDKSRKKLMIKRRNLLPLSSEYYGYSGIATDSIQLALDYEQVPIGEGLTDEGNAVQINADTTDGYVNAWGDESLRLTGNFTIEAWIYPTGPGIDPIWGGVIVNREGEYEIARMSDGTIQWALRNSSPGWTWINTQYQAPENQWVHLAIVYNQSEVKAYFNGKLFATNPATGSIGDLYTNLNNFEIGARQWDINQRFQGFIDEVRVWNQARSASEIYSTFNDTLSSAYYATSDSGLIGYWRLDSAEDTGEGVLVSKDLSVNGNDGWLYGDTKLSGLPTKIDSRNIAIPAAFELDQNYPNPFNPVTTIGYRLQKAADIDLAIYNIAGQKIRTLFKGNQSAGNYTLKWNGMNDFGLQVASGVYLYQMMVDGKALQSRKMVLMR